MSAHRGALAVGGLTVAVLAGRLSYGYPRAHEAMFAAIAARGMLVSESRPAAPRPGQTSLSGPVSLSFFQLI
jgi:DNA processing protein